MPRDQFTRMRTFRNETETSFSRCPVFCGKVLLLLAQLMLLWEHINITVHPQQVVTSKPWVQTWITIAPLNWEGREVVSPVAGEHIVPSCLAPVSLARARVPLLAHCTPHQKAVGWEAGCGKDHLSAGVCSSKARGDVPCWCSQKRFAPGQSMTPLCPGNRERAFAPVTGDCSVGGIHPAARCILHLMQESDLAASASGRGELQFSAQTRQWAHGQPL